MGYPTLEQYNEAFQYPRHALSDPELKQGNIATTGLGLPLALCGGFALTYTINCGAKKYAVRCFHKQSHALEDRYRSISTCLKRQQSPYFVDFEFQPQGVLVQGGSYPVVKMAWATGTTLGQFLEQNYSNPANLKNLGTSLQTLAKYLEGHGMAHGDIQPGNVMVADAGRSLQLIDYDGIFVNELSHLGSAELGHRNFQHPKRTEKYWNSTLDRFSFISLDVAIKALAVSPELWARTQSDGDAILFKANDFANPSQSAIFSDLLGVAGSSTSVHNFAAICSSAFDQTPSLEDFIAARNIPKFVGQASSSHSTNAIKYLSAFPILDANNYADCSLHVGDRVELIGKIVEVKSANTRHGSPYVFINFGPWQGDIVKITIWSEGLDALTTKPSRSWVGQWISVVGLMDPAYENKRFNYSHLSISITKGSQLHVIPADVAKFRLGGSSTRASVTRSISTNGEILAALKAGGVTRQAVATPSKGSLGNATSTVRKTKNQDILNNIRKARPVTAGPAAIRLQASTRSNPTPKPPAPNNSSCFIATEVYGTHASETNALREWRDRSLLPHPVGRAFVTSYYIVSPHLVPVIHRNRWLKSTFKCILDRVVRFVSR